ncbi:unnamed protein product [Arabidopsis halleri]
MVVQDIRREREKEKKKTRFLGESGDEFWKKKKRDSIREKESFMAEVS